MFTRILMALIATAVFCSCGFNTVQKHTLKANFDVAVTDPDIRNFTNITQKVKLEATGEFAPGVFLMGTTPVSCSPGTRFQLQMELPIDNPQVISTRYASGALTLSQPISVAMVPTPQEISLTGGKVNAAVDLGRSLGAFFINLLQVGQPRSDLRKLVQSMCIQKATLYLRDGSQLKLGDRTINIGSDSTVSLENAEINSELNYEALCLAKLNLKKCDWIGEKVDTLFESGTTNVRLKAKKKYNVLTLKMMPETKVEQELILNKCSFRFGKNKRSSTLSDRCELDLKDFSWRRQGNTAPSTMHLVSAMNLTGTKLKLKTDIHTTDGYFAQALPGILELNIKASGPRELKFETTSSATAESGCITIAKGQTNLKLWLDETTVGPVSYDKFGSLHFTLEKGTAKFKQLDIESAKSKFSLVAAGESTLQLPGTMLIDKEQSTTPTKLKLPLELKMGEAKLVTPTRQVKLSNLTGLITIDVDKQIELTSDMSFLIEKSALFGDHSLDVTVKGIDVFVKNGQTDLRLRNCNLCIPEQALCESITKRLPKTLVFEPEKNVMEKQRWRYKNAIVNIVKIRNIELSAVHPAGQSTLGFEVEGDVDLEGTIEKGSILAVIGSTNKWETRPWTLNGHIEGAGTVKYSFTDKSAVKYDLSLELPLPEDLKLDWSKVADGFLKSAEKKAILSRLHKITVPIHHQGEMDLFSRTDSHWSHFIISGLSCKAAEDDIDLAFTAQAHRSSTAAK